MNRTVEVLRRRSKTSLLLHLRYTISLIVEAVATLLWIGAYAWRETRLYLIRVRTDVRLAEIDAEQRVAEALHRERTAVGRPAIPEHPAILEDPTE